MSERAVRSHSVMEGNGAYNKYAKLQAGGAALALPYLERAVRNIDLDSAERPVVIADYGSSQGKNSLAPIQLALTKSELLAPFAQGEEFQGLTVECFDMSAVVDAAWADYEQDGNKDVLAAKHALFFRSAFMPSLAGALTRVRAGDTEALESFGDRLEHGLKRHLTCIPAAMHSFVQTIVLAKQCSV